MLIMSAVLRCVVVSVFLPNLFFILILRRLWGSLFPYTTLFRSLAGARAGATVVDMSTVSPRTSRRVRSEEHTSELQSHSDLVCRLLLEKKKPSVDRSVTVSIFISMCGLILILYCLRGSTDSFVL